MARQLVQGFLLLIFEFILFCITSFHVGAMATATSAISSAVTGNETDKVALLALKSKISHDPQGVMSSWNDSLHFCKWEGITCGRKHRRVAYLDLNSRGLVGLLSPFIGNLSFLRRIDLGNNTLQGNIPQDIGRLFRLQVVDLQNNSLVGEIPTNLSHCYKLKYLHFGHNKLAGKIPLEIAFLSNLRTLALHQNNLVGGIPTFLGNQTALEGISLAYNILGGSIPDALGRLRNLSTLMLSGNNLSGEIPLSLYNLSLLTIFSLSENQLHGSLPSNLGLNFPNLQWFQVSVNSLSGSIPVSLSNASELEHVEFTLNNFVGRVTVNFGGMGHLSVLLLDYNNLESGEADGMSFLNSLANCSNLLKLSLAKNRFKGVLPGSITNLSTQLQILDISVNEIYGAIPSGFTNLINLNMLFLHYNRFTGTIPIDIGKLGKLQSMSLSNNKLLGKIPCSLGNLSLLNQLYLQNNKLQGVIPPSLGNCQKLQVLYLSQNNLKGAIPKQILGISSLSISLNLAQNYLVGSIPSEVGNLKSLTELDVSENKLSGEIPSSLSECVSLENLFIEGNFFQGPIPLSLSSLRGIRNLDLSRNNLSGQIPQFLETMLLENLNLSFNDFEDRVPIKGVFTNASAISVAGNNRLCGGIHELQLPICTISKSKKRKMPLVHIIIVSVGCVLLITIMSALLFCLLEKKRKRQSSRSLQRESLLKVSYQSLHKATEGFSSKYLIGVGSFGSVYKGILDQGTTLFAIKVLNLERQGAFKSFMAECKVLKAIRHRNLVKIITSCSSVDFQGNNFKALIYEFMPNGSLETWLHSTPETEGAQDELQKLSFFQRMNIAIDVACALDYLHHHCEKPIVHCDLKPSNVLLDNDMTAHVGDFGLAKFLPNLKNPSQSSSLGIRGTIGYTAPEYGLGSEASTNGDVYSYGILLLEMMTNKRPTDRMFGEGINLHNYARSALPERVKEIVDPLLLNNEEAEAVHDSCNPRHSRHCSRREECLISVVKIGVACSMESPQDRMDVSNVVNELHKIRGILLRTETRH